MRILEGQRVSEDVFSCLEDISEVGGRYIGMLRSRVSWIVFLASASDPTRVEGLNRDFVSRRQEHTTRSVLAEHLSFVQAHIPQ